MPSILIIYQIQSMNSLVRTVKNDEINVVSMSGISHQNEVWRILKKL